MRYISATFSLYGPLEKKVHAIKGVRQLTGMGLTESKDFVESLETGPKNMTLGFEITDETAALSKELLDKAQIDFILVRPNTKVRINIAEQIQSIATYATISSQYDLAREMITIMERYFPDGVEENKPFDFENTVDD